MSLAMICYHCSEPITDDHLITVQVGHNRKKLKRLNYRQDCWFAIDPLPKAGLYALAWDTPHLIHRKELT